MLRKLDPKTTALFLCDIQEKFRKHIFNFCNLIKNTNRMGPNLKYSLYGLAFYGHLTSPPKYEKNFMNRECPHTGGFTLVAAKELEIPVFLTEQYPKGLGPVVKDLNICSACSKFEKTSMSMWIPALKEKLGEKYEGKPCDVLLCGMETQACIEQTAVDLMENDINVYLLADCVSSRTAFERDLALERLRQAGCIISTYENAIFWLLQDKDHPKFDAVRHVLTNPSADMGLGPKK